MQASRSFIDQLRILVRRKWIVLAFVLIVPAAAVLYSQQQPKRYEASSQVLLKTQNLASTLVGIPDTSSQDTPDRQAQTEAGLARVPEVANRVLRSQHVGGVTVDEFLGSSSVNSISNSNLLEFRVRAETPEEAARLATAYASEYVVYKQRLDTAAISKAEEDVSASLDKLGESAASSGLYASLLKTRQSLKTLAALQTSNAILVKKAASDSAAQVQPRPGRNGALGVVLGLLLGCAAAFLANALDTRVSDEEIGEQYQSPLIARIPKPPVRTRKANKLVMLEAPSSVQAEAYRLLITNLEFLLLAHPARTVMITSALDSEGKSPVAANLALALAQTGKEIRLVDLDLRRPALATYFDMPSLAGLTDVAIGSVPLDQALLTIPAESSLWHIDDRSSDTPVVIPAGTPTLELLTAGQIPPNPSELIGSDAVADLIASLEKQSDLVIVDAPPLLAVADALVISRSVDAIIVVARRHSLRRRAASEAARLLRTSQTPILGYVLVDAEAESSAYYRYSDQPRRRFGRLEV